MLELFGRQTCIDGNTTPWISVNLWHSEGLREILRLNTDIVWCGTRSESSNQPRQWRPRPLWPVVAQNTRDRDTMRYHILCRDMQRSQFTATCELWGNMQQAKQSKAKQIDLQHTGVIFQAPEQLLPLLQNNFAKQSLLRSGRGGAGVWYGVIARARKNR